MLPFSPAIICVISNFDACFLCMPTTFLKNYMKTKNATLIQIVDYESYLENLFTVHMITDMQSNCYHLLLSLLLLNCIQ